jgi:hypothetical protein
MEYALKFGPVGRLLDAMVVRRKWQAEIQGFLAGLKDFVELGRASRNAVDSFVLKPRDRAAKDAP